MCLLLPPLSLWLGLDVGAEAGGGPLVVWWLVEVVGGAALGAPAL